MEETIFTNLFGNSPKVKIMELLIIGRELEYCISDMAEYSGVGRSTIYRFIENLIKNKIIIERKKIGRIRLYQINQSKPEVKILIKMMDALSNINSNKEIKKTEIALKAKH